MSVFHTTCRIVCLGLVALAALPAAGATTAGDEAERPVITRKDDLPRHTYQLTTPVTALYDDANRDALIELAEAVAADIRDDLSRFDIRDDNTVQAFYAVLGADAALRGDWTDYLEYLDRRRRLETKRANQLTMGLAGEAISRAAMDGRHDPEAIAAQLRARVGTLPYAEVQEFLESLGAYSGYAHGTHVAGIALEGNPFARLLTARMTYPYTLLPEKPTLEQAHRDAAMMRDTIAYFQANGVRAVNMSWGGSLRMIESALEAHSVGETPEARKALARDIYSINDTALREAIQDASDILFIISAGNSDNDIRFDEYFPSSYDYPNVLTVGAVDSAGDETSFTSLGKVDIYANGHEVESYVPGGNRIAFSGTSMSSPQVTNLAGKLLALAPDLGMGELRDLILAGGEEKDLGERRILLMDPRASRQLLEASR